MRFGPYGGVEIINFNANIGIGIGINVIVGFWPIISTNTLYVSVTKFTNYSVCGL
jgi:hypothetical protein